MLFISDGISEGKARDVPSSSKTESENTEKSTDEEFERRVFQNWDKDLLIEPESNEIGSDDSDEDEQESGRVLRPRTKKVTFK